MGRGGPAGGGRGRRVTGLRGAGEALERLLELRLQLAGTEKPCPTLGSITASPFFTWRT